ncbi:hypothetical protein Y032_0014g2421 [Ancylostoma ceylanicum]|uniref:Uncharacterized protein n=1 Tax=Ancylostoma ceylanicum TaxID=53326 RepID=A0A016VC21_9BILA|nr:hypothetical protein Y032_0014g2421 [Ancylostoma ceylanicum]
MKKKGCAGRKKFIKILNFLDKVTAEALTPVMLHIQDKGTRLKKTRSVSYSYKTPPTTARSRETSKSRKSRTLTRSKKKTRKNKEVALANAITDALGEPTNDDIVIHETLPDGSMKLQLHFSSRLKQGDEQSDTVGFQPHKITLSGQEIWNNK